MNDDKIKSIQTRARYQNGGYSHDEVLILCQSLLAAREALRDCMKDICGLHYSGADRMAYKKGQVALGEETES